MTILVLFILAVVWAVVIGAWLRERAGTRRIDSVSSFRQQLTTLQRTGPSRRYAAPGQPATHEGSQSLAGSRRSSGVRPEVRRRRRDVLFTLLAVTGFTLLLALVLQSAITILLFLLSGALLGGYVWLLRQAQVAAVERQHKVRYLHPRTTHVTTDLPLRRSASAN